jgi:hypothetical protein
MRGMKVKSQVCSRGHALNWLTVTTPDIGRAVTRESKDSKDRSFSRAQTKSNCLTKCNRTIYESLEVSGVTGQEGDIISILYTRVPSDKAGPRWGQCTAIYRWRPSRNKPKRVGLKGQPCLTPVREGAEAPTLPPTFIARLEVA